MAKRDWVPTDDEVINAKAVLERAYRSWVNDLVEELIFDTFNEDIDEDEFRERVDERTDSGLIYTTDQWTALFSSLKAQEAWDELRDMDSTNVEDPVGAWGVLTYRQDVNEDLGSADLLKPLQNGASLEERVSWLIEEHGGREVPLKEGESVYLIGDVNDVSFGILHTFNGHQDHEFIGRGLDEGAMKAVLDLALEHGGDFNAPAVRDFIRKAR